MQQPYNSDQSKCKSSDISPGMQIFPDFPQPWGTCPGQEPRASPAYPPPWVPQKRPPTLGTETPHPLPLTFAHTPYSSLHCSSSHFLLPSSVRPYGLPQARVLGPASRSTVDQTLLLAQGIS